MNPTLETVVNVHPGVNGKVSNFYKLLLRKVDKSTEKIKGDWDEEMGSFMTGGGVNAWEIYRHALWMQDIIWFSLRYCSSQASLFQIKTSQNVSNNSSTL